MMPSDNLVMCVSQEREQMDNLHREESWSQEKQEIGLSECFIRSVQIRSNGGP